MTTVIHLAPRSCALREADGTCIAAIFRNSTLGASQNTSTYTLEGRHLRKEITGAVRLSKEYII